MMWEKYIANDQVASKFHYFLWSLLLILGINHSLFSQDLDSSFIHIKKIPVNAIFFTTDKLKQVYVVNTKNELIKYNADALEVFRFSNNTLGKLDYVDATNPFNILLYYSAFRTLITLDRTLNKTGEFDLFDLDVEEVKAVALSNDNNIWLYDDVAFQIKKINAQGKILVASDNLSLLLGHTISPNFILEKENKLYVNSPNHGILIFDIFGHYLNTLAIKDLDRFQVEEGHLIYHKDKHLVSFHFQSLHTKTSTVPGIPLETNAIRVQRKTLYVMRPTKIDIYQF